MNMKKKMVILGILLMILGIAGIGCYTILSHPTVQGEEADNVEQNGQYYRENCTNCHADYHQYPYGFYYGYYPDYYWNNPRWGHYYAYPWWWDNYWWDNNNDNSGGGGTTMPESADKAERRRGIEPPYVRPNAASNTPFVPPTSTKTDQGTEEKKPEAIKIKQPEQQQQPAEKSDKEKPERRRK
jgi:hypothetical protein